MSKSQVYLIKTTNRKEGINKLLEYYPLEEFQNSKVVVKANFNSSDPFPASTHPDTLRFLLEKMQGADVTVIERSGMGDTRKVLEKLGIIELSQELGFQVIVLEEEGKESWHRISGEDNHWLRGFYLPKILFESDKIIQTCCLKTHRFGGHFTISLKNSVGLVAKKIPGGIYNYMGELHLSPYQRKMIAEINNYYPTHLILLDAIKAMVTKGPERGVIVEPQLLLAAEDRVALDAVGVAILRYYGTTPRVADGPIFELEQIKRAAELKIGVERGEDIEIKPLTDESQIISEEIEEILRKT